MSTMFADTLLIVFISVCTALLAEGERIPGPGRRYSAPRRRGPGPLESAGASLCWEWGLGSAGEGALDCRLPQALAGQMTAPAVQQWTSVLTE